METHRLVIETAENGFLVYVNQDFSQGTIRPRPYVFQTIESLFNFIKDNFSEKQSTANALKEIHRRTPII